MDKWDWERTESIKYSKLNKLENLFLEIRIYYQSKVD